MITGVIRHLVSIMYIQTFIIYLLLKIYINIHKMYIGLYKCIGAVVCISCQIILTDSKMQQNEQRSRMLLQVVLIGGNIYVERKNYLLTNIKESVPELFINNVLTIYIDYTCTTYDGSYSIFTVTFLHICKIRFCEAQATVSLHSKLD